MTKYVNNNGVSEMWLNIKNWATSQLLGYSQTGHTHTKSEITDFPSLATVATSGSYSDLSNKPTIPTNTNQLTNGSGYLSGTVGISNGGTGAVTSTGAVANLTNDHIGTSSQYFLTITDGWARTGYASVADAKSVLGVPSIDLRPQASADANTVSDGVSITHYGSNGPATSLGASTNDGALFQQCWSSAWKVQIAADYRNGNLFTRGKNNGTWQPWRAVAYHGDNVSNFTNDSGYITSSGSCNYANSAGSAGSVAWGNVSGRPTIPTNTSQLTNDSGFLTGVTWNDVNNKPSFATVATSGSYNDLSNKPAIPTVNNGTLTIQQNGVNVQTFTANQSGNATANIVTPAVNDGTLTIMVDGITAGTFTANQSTDTIVALTSGGGGSADLLPIGSYIQFAGSQAPDGFLVCNGGAISRTTYSALFAVIGTTYGSGDGSTTFNLPNLTDRFLQGSTTSGTVKNAGLPNITGYFGGAVCLGDERAGAFNKYGNQRGVAGNDTGVNSRFTSRYDFDASRSSSIYGSSSTVQPPALTCLICIKY